ncbi:MAG: hypothetical protein LBU65_00190 [Planctomycetaceae bacterium]|jgi:hypothetical protein|nr:hypothetical protein [Planctomycetaceae bacterium]
MAVVKVEKIDTLPTNKKKDAVSPEISDILDNIGTLSTEQKMFIVEKIIHSARKDGGFSKKRKQVKSTNPDNPSPSGDTWFDDPENLRSVYEGIHQVREGKGIRLEDCESLQKIFAKCREK